jgi:origin recognition complex subunit 5
LLRKTYLLIHCCVVHRSGALAVEKKEAEAQKRQLRGPGSFPLERMLAIFRCIVVEHDDRYPNGLSHLLPSETSQQTEEAAAAAGGDLTEELTADVLMQVTTLVSVNLLYKNSTNPLERLTRYCCNIDSELIQKVCAFFSLQLTCFEVA